MKTFEKPLNLNGDELRAELAAVGIIVERIVVFGDKSIHFETDNEELARSIVAAHNGNTAPVEPTIADKLASVGVSIDDLKAALGLGGN